MTDKTDPARAPDAYAVELFAGYTEAEIAEIEALMANWDQATYPTLAMSIVKHARKHGFSEAYLKYLRKAANFNKKGAQKKLLPMGAIRWHKGSQFLIERHGKTVTYGENA